jgi:hypothetical protein
MSRRTLVRGSYQHGDALARALRKASPHDLGKLAWVDPYGDTLFNEQEAQATLSQAAALSKGCTDGPEKAAVDDLLAMLEACAATPGSHLWFMGD